MALGILMDIAGVLYDGEREIDGAAKAIMETRNANVPIRFLTNSTRRPKRKILEKLQSFDISAENFEVMTPAEAACAWLRKNDYTPHLVIHPDLEEDFENTPSNGRVAVVVGDAASYFTYEALNAAYRELAKGAPLLALACNRVFQESDGLLSLDAGAFVKALEFASGGSAILLGKPSKRFFEAGARSMGLSPNEVVMVGDDAENDVAGAILAGLRGGILVRTGKFRAGDEEKFKPPPSFVAADVGEAVRFALVGPS